MTDVANKQLRHRVNEMIQELGKISTKLFAASQVDVDLPFKERRELANHLDMLIEQYVEPLADIALQGDAVFSLVRAVDDGAVSVVVDDTDKFDLSQISLL